MTPAENFLSFKDLQDLTSATDQQIVDMLAFGCQQAPVANFEDVITEHLLRLFRHITGVLWVRGWEQGARPDGQYGTIWLYASKTKGQPQIEYASVIDSNTGLVVDDFCEVVYQPFEYQFQLDVYRDSGSSTRNQELSSATPPGLSAADVLHRLITALGHPRFRSALKEACLFLGTPSFGTVRNFAKPIIQNTFESRSGVDFYIRAATMSSLRSPTYGDIDWGFVCPPEDQMFPDPPETPIC